MFRCLSCGNTDRLRIAAAVTVVPKVNADGEVETEPLDNEHEWDGTSFMWCAACGQTGNVLAFETDT